MLSTNLIIYKQLEAQASNRMQKSISSQLISLNSLTALAFAANFLITQIHFQLSPQILALSCLTICVIPAYQFIKTQKVNVLIAAVSGMAICLFLCTAANASSTSALFMAIVFSVTYNRNPNFGWRNNPFSKVAIVALVWTLTTVLIPLLLANTTVDLPYLILRFGLFCLQILLFEIADLPTDIRNTRSIPQLFAARFLKLILAVCAPILAYLLEDGVFAILLTAYLLFVIIRTKPGNRCFADVFVEAVPLFYLILKWIALF
ncbi:hypothetical protein CHX27_07460 [Flavobacterium aurantiibacter]|uniref:Uncharacterized protein n=2 Tax=Flavobacterium aurantiibacter TaxID=2023067 RepID=A0A255ZSH5_9FLAO|nr:hypothetical protein CHX27_07460 [Flavobacterium aurantiibacter]